MTFFFWHRWLSGKQTNKQKKQCEMFATLFKVQLIPFTVTVVSESNIWLCSKQLLRQRAGFTRWPPSAEFSFWRPESIKFCCSSVSKQENEITRKREKKKTFSRAEQVKGFLLRGGWLVIWPLHKRLRLSMKVYCKTNALWGPLQSIIMHL